jgi:hypothetical protein
MRRHLLVLTIAGLFGALVLASDASACCHRTACPTPVVCAPPPPPVCEPVVCKPKRCGLFGGHKLFGCCHRPKCEPPPAPVCEVVPMAPAPIPSPQYIAPTPQAAPTPAAPSKQASRGGPRLFRVAFLGR